MKRRKRSREGAFTPFLILICAVTVTFAWMGWLASVGIPFFHATRRHSDPWSPDPFTPLEGAVAVVVGVATLVLALFATLYIRSRSERHADFDPYCGECRVNLLGSWPLAMRCPECGADCEYPIAGHATHGSLLDLVQSATVSLLILAANLTGFAIILRVFQ